MVGAPEEIKNALLGDIEISKGNVDKSIELYSKSNSLGLEVSDELILAYVLKHEYSKVISLYKRQKKPLTSRSMLLVVRSYIELGLLEEAKKLLLQLPNSKALQRLKHHVDSLMNVPNTKPLNCTVQSISEKLYCSRLFVMKGEYSKAFSYVSDLHFGDPVRSIVELLIAMRKNDAIAMDDSIKSFAYGQPRLLHMEHPKFAYIPSLSLDEVAKLLLSNNQGKESEAILEWALLNNPKSLQSIDIVSAPTCAAMIQIALEHKNYRVVQEKLRCLEFFEMDEKLKKFYRRFSHAHESPDMYPKTYWKDLLGDSTPRSLWYWAWKDKKTIDNYNRLFNISTVYFSFGTRWFRSQNGYID